MLKLDDAVTFEGQCSSRPQVIPGRKKNSQICKEIGTVRKMILKSRFPVPLKYCILIRTSKVSQLAVILQNSALKRTNQLGFTNLLGVSQWITGSFDNNYFWKSIFIKFDVHY